MAYFRKNKHIGGGGEGQELRTWNFQGYQKNKLWKFQGKEKEFTGMIKKKSCRKS